MILIDAPGLAATPRFRREIEKHRMAPLTAYYWSNINVLSHDMMRRGLADRVFPGGWDNVHHVHERGGPLAYVLTRRSDSAALITVRGTRSARDLMIDASVTCPSIATLYREVSKECARLPAPLAAVLENAALDVMERRVEVHAGIFMGAVRCMAGVVNALASDPSCPFLFEPDRVRVKKNGSVVFHGHSLGAAVASFMYAWMRDAIQSPSQRRLVSCACMSCPRITDHRGYTAFFKLHDLPGQYRHYYTHGDVVVESSTATVPISRTHHPTLTHHVCPLAPIKPAASAFKKLISHVVFIPSMFRRIRVASRRPDLDANLKCAFDANLKCAPDANLKCAPDARINIDLRCSTDAPVLAGRAFWVALQVQGSKDRLDSQELQSALMKVM
jgi:hypothetical protein